MNATQYAAYLGVSKVAVHAYIRKGKIPAVKVGKEYQIDPAAADQALENNRSPILPPIAKTRIKPVARVAALEPADSVAATLTQPATTKPLPEPAVIDPTVPTRGPTYADAQRAKMVYQAERERLALLREKGELVLVSEVKNRWFTHGRAIRDGMTGIPARVASQLAAMVDAREVATLLDQEITVALRGLADE